MTTNRCVLIGLIGFTILQVACVEPKGRSSLREKEAKDNNIFSMKSSDNNDNNLEEEIMSDIVFNYRSDVVNYLNQTFKNVNSEVTLKGSGPYAYVGNVMIGTIEVYRFNSRRAIIKWGSYPFVVDLDCDCMINDAEEVYKPFN